MIKRNTKIFLPTWLILMMLRCVDAAYPLHPVAYNAHPKDECDITDERPKYPGRVAEQGYTKYGFAPHQGTNTCDKQCTQQGPHHLKNQATRDSSVTIEAKEKSRDGQKQGKGSRHRAIKV